ncbi:MAG TPA: DEAD/DEAH box helicase [Geminicoccus sp.]|uniref:DEAD/DEAH box helicase n=1 Tax=Geminicoccus sp. TaxID=2024832 RepID=UPI002CFF0030|nr:DEAD/DEAH box helicase [Geminicoccus sp.]HWL69506.1 DEAD/DEAH box helicase [Geminicoccus sp.]
MPPADSPADAHADSRPVPTGLLAARLLHLLTAEPTPLIHVVADLRLAQVLAAQVQAMAPDLPVAVLPEWDSLPYERMPPSVAVMGQRMGMLRWFLDQRARPRLILTTAPALLRLVPPRTVWVDAGLEFRVGDPVDLGRLRIDLLRQGYVVDERVDEPGEAALRGQVIDLFPAAAPLPCRIEHQDGRISEIRSYDPVSQRSEVETDLLIVDPASEIVLPRPADGAVPDFPRGREHELARYYGRLESVFDYLPDARLVLDPHAVTRATDFLEQAAEAWQARQGPGDTALPPEQLFLQEDGWRERTAAARDLEHRVRPDERVPRFVESRDSARQFRDFLQARLAEGPVVLAAGDPRPLRALASRARQATGRSAAAAKDWQEAAAAPPGALLTLTLPVRHGFVDQASGAAVIAAADLLGTRAEFAQAATRAALPLGEADLGTGDVVVHLDHGMGVLEGLEEVTLAEDEPGEVLRLRYAGDKTLLVPVGEIGRIWRYGGDPEAVTLDRLDGDGWTKRRAGVENGIRATAMHLVEQAARRARASAPKLTAPARDYERFVARFPYPLTPDQAAAEAAVLADLTAGRPMDRLVCGDVGFGKTEIALRAAAVAVLAGRQVAIAAPTTVLARQHARTFARRFAHLGIEVALLSRLVKPAEARKVKAGLADGSIRLVIGTHALAARGVRFAELGLLVIDEEQRFGAAQKAKLRALAEGGGHVLTMTATPIPRTLQASLVGLQELSLITTPPVQRQPIRTQLHPFDEAMVRDALLHERQRGGQSFVVCPRIEDIAPMAERLARIVPELHMVVAHGKLPADEVDATMVGFAEGEGEILLATNIIESGLDVPRANTMLVWRPERFGLAQLHQLRGRVGRGSRSATALLLTDPDHPPAPAAEKRLRTLEALDRLGAGFAISARDLDLRGAGDLIGEEQAGHVTTLGLGLYQHLLDQALRRVRGETVADDWLPELHLGVTGRIPADYVPEPDMRIDLYARAARVADAADVAAFMAELEDRFGPVPPGMTRLLAQARILAACRRLGIGRLDAGPQGLALTLRDEAPVPALPGWIRKDRRLVLARAIEDPEERLDLLLAALEVATESPEEPPAAA